MATDPNFTTKFIVDSSLVSRLVHLCILIAKCVGTQGHHA
jgi:hypothetical protein